MPLILPDRESVMPIQWTPTDVKNFREKLHITQDYIADICGVSPVTISHLETYKVRNPMAIQMYGILLERIYAYQNGYLPAFRKTGTNEFMEGTMNVNLETEDET